MKSDPSLVVVPQFLVAGSTIRTSNANECDPAKAKIPGLWGTFFGDGLMTRIPHRADRSSVFGVYSKYESDANGPYDLTAGVAVVGEVERFSTVVVPSGGYLVFERRGSMPQIVIEGWKEIWEYFANSQRFRRAFTTDFEEYMGPDHVAIHVAVVGDGR